MAMGQNYLNRTGQETLTDYWHASNLFTSNGFENAPRYQYLFHVYFNLNVVEIPALQNIFPSPDLSTIGLLVKTIQLPQFKIGTETLNQYNRKRVIQKRIDYEAVPIVFHDDGGDLIRTMWYNYYSYYYKDPTQPYRGQSASNGANGVNANRTAGFGYNTRDIYANDRFVNDWGYIGESYTDSTNGKQGGKPAFFKDISIYGFDQHKFVEYVLINPIISDWKHDTYDYSQGNGVMENSMTIQYETVKYYTGAIGSSRPDTNVQSFGAPYYYDQGPSPLNRPGGTSSSVGNAGIQQAGLGRISDMQTGSVASPVGGNQQALTQYGTIRGPAQSSIYADQYGITNGSAISIAQQTANGVRLQPNGSTILNQQLQAPIFPVPPRPITVGGVPLITTP